jgi:hypothetical protein
LIYANVHLDYGFKRTTGWLKASNGIDSSNPNPGGVGGPALLHGFNSPGFPWGQPYILKGYANDVPLCTVNNVCQDTIYSVNIFKKNVGVAGVVANALDTGQPGWTVTMYTDPARTPASQVGVPVVTDADGAYFINYKNTGGSRQFWLKATKTGSADLPGGPITLKSNGFGIVNFTCTVCP